MLATVSGRPAGSRASPHHVYLRGYGNGRGASGAGVGPAAVDRHCERGAAGTRTFVPVFLDRLHCDAPIAESANAVPRSAFSLAFCDLFIGLGSFAAGGVAATSGYPATFLMAVAALVGSGFTGWYVLPVESGQPVSERSAQEAG